MEGNITISFYTEDKPLCLNDEQSYVVEDLCIRTAKHLGIGPVGRHLFAMWYPAHKVYFPPCRKLDIHKGKKYSLVFRLRYKINSIQLLKFQTDPATFNYYFHQLRCDFLDGNLPILFDRQYRDKALGLVAADIIRWMLENKHTPDTVKYNSRDFLPSELKRSPLWDNFLRDPLQKAVNKGWVNSKQDAEYVKETYLVQMHVIVKDYLAEYYSGLIEAEGRIYELEMYIDPYDSRMPGLRMHVVKTKDPDWSHTCTIENLCYISMRKDETVELSRQNGVPQYVQFHTADQMHSFVSALDGYYRLMEKWTFNLCKDLQTPSLVKLRAMKCHGPIEPKYAYKKLQEKSLGEVGSYLLRENGQVYDEYCLDVCVAFGDLDNMKIKTFIIYQDEDDNYALEGFDVGFPSIPQLISYYSRTSDLKLKRCIPPSEYDKTNLLLCRDVNKENRLSKMRGDCSCFTQCIPHDAVIFDDRPESEVFGHLTVVRRGLLKRSSSDFRDVAVKMLRKEAKVTHLQEFLTQCDRVLFLQHDAIVSTVGMILTKPTSMVMEYLPLGRLDFYLQHYEEQVRQVDLVEAAYHIARALWYLEEQQWFHGKIRCRNILVASYSENSFKVKLADPGLIVYSDADIHWIPPECYQAYSAASRSVAADVFAYGTTLWEIFSYGAKPLANLSPKEAKEWYQKGNLLDLNPSYHNEVNKVILECWSCDPDNRKRPQHLVRDLNQILYEVYNSRRGHSYATIGPGTTPVLQNNSVPMKPPTPPPNRPPKEPGLNILKNVFKWQAASNGRTFPYNLLPQSSNSGSSGQSTCTIETYVDRDSSIVNVNSLDSISESDPDPLPDIPSFTPGDLSWVIDKEQLTIKGTLGQGFYGEVLRATLTHCSGLTTEEVAVKRIRMTNQSAACFTDLKREIEIMKNLRHKNIVEIKGLVEEPETMLVMEFLELGSLLLYLQLHKDKLGVSHLLKFAADVAEGMEYLEKKHIVHRDLASRNILVASERHVKISDFGLAQFTEDHYYRMRTERNLPIRWYALESITEGKFSHKSDVWSYGITLWEMFSYGENPEIPGVPDTALNEALLQGQRLGITPSCPAFVYTLMRSCWEKDSHERPTFTEILQKIHQLKSELCS